MQTINNKGLIVKDLVTVSIFSALSWCSPWWAVSFSPPTPC